MSAESESPRQIIMITEEIDDLRLQGVPENLIQQFRADIAALPEIFVMHMSERLKGEALFQFWSSMVKLRQKP